MSETGDKIEAAKQRVQEQAEAKKEATATEYVILRLHAAVVVEEPPAAAGQPVGREAAVWEPCGRRLAANKDAAIDGWTEEEEESGTFKAVAAKSWAGGKRVFEHTRMVSEPLEE
jgi:hypothetical protein